MKTHALAAALALLGACSPANVGVDGGAAATATEPTCKDYAYAYCARLAACSSTAVQARFVTVETCEKIYDASCSAAIDLPSSGATAAGRSACVSAFGAWSCTDFLASQNPPPACMPASGGLPMGATCASGVQCQSTSCAIPAGSGCGTCAPVPQAGDACAVIPCGQGLDCPSVSLTCTSLGSVGAPCSLAAPCNDGLSCQGGYCETEAASLGASCDVDGAGCDGAKGLGCSVTGKCVNQLLALPGQACGLVVDQPTSCLGGDCLRGACVGRVPAGGACTIDGPACTIDTRCVVPGSGTKGADAGAVGTCQLDGTVACD